MRAIVLLAFLTVCLAANPGLRLTLTQKFINSFLQQQLPLILPQNLIVPEIVKNTTHSNFLANISSLSLTNLDLDYLNSEVTFDETNNKLTLRLSNLNLDLTADYLIRALYFETAGHITVQNNMTLTVEVTSRWDAGNQKPVLDLTSFQVNYNEFNILFGGSILAYLIDLIEGFCDCVVREQYPNLLDFAVDFALKTAVDGLNGKFIFDALNITELGLDLGIPQPVENANDHLSAYVNAIFYDPYDPMVAPPGPSVLIAYNSSHEGIEVALNQGVFNSLLWTINNQKLLDFTLKGDQIPIQLPFTFEIDTKLFELALPEFYNYYGSNKIVDLVLTTNGTAPRLTLQESGSTIILDVEESITFMVRLNDTYDDEAFTVNFSLSATVNQLSTNGTYFLLNLDSISLNDNVLVKSKIPGLNVQGLDKMVNSTLKFVVGMANTYLKLNPIPVPTIEGVELSGLELLVRDENLVLAVDPVVRDLSGDLHQTILDFLRQCVHRVRV